jgi:protease I
MRLKDKKIAIFLADLYEDLEFWYPYIRMQEAGAEVTAIGPKAQQYAGKHGLPANAEKAIHEVKAIEYDALIIPGGYSPDHMRRSPEMVKFVQEMHKQRKPIAAICHGPWMLASADIIKGVKLTSFYSIKDDLVHAGAEWVDEKSVHDGRANIITSRDPHDLPAFCTEIIEVVSRQVTAGAAAS